jgi:hypothetical protein
MGSRPAANPRYLKSGQLASFFWVVTWMRFMYLHVDKRSFMMGSSISAGCTTGPAVRITSTIILTSVCQVDKTSFHQLISWWFTQPHLARLVARAAEGCGRGYWFSSSRHDWGLSVCLLAQLLQRPLLQIFSLLLLQQFQATVIRLTPFRADNIWMLTV